MKTLYLEERGMNDNSITTDIKNHRICTTENIDIIYNGKKYNMFFEFTQGTRRKYRTTNKRTGKPLKKAICEVVMNDGLFIDTQYEKDEINSRGFIWQSSWRLCKLEEEVYKELHKYTRADILQIINRYAIEKYNKVVLIEEEARRIINTAGGWREKDILGAGKNFQTEGDSYMQRGETWTDEHKIIRINKRAWKKTTDGRQLKVVDFCEVDIVTGKITG